MPTMRYHVWLCMGSGDLNSRPHDPMTNTLLTEPLLQPSVIIIVLVCLLVFCFLMTVKQVLKDM